mgnify:CR=1 FL=1
MEKQKLAVFNNKKIRRFWDDREEKWYFSVIDIISALTDSDKPRDYWYRMKQREQESTGVELSTFCRQLKLESADGKKYETDWTVRNLQAKLFTIFAKQVKRD